MSGGPGRPRLQWSVQRVWAAGRPRLQWSVRLCYVPVKVLWGEGDWGEPGEGAGTPAHALHSNGVACRDMFWVRLCSRGVRAELNLMASFKKITRKVT